MPSLRESHRKAYGRISSECTQLEYPRCTGKFHKHSQETALNSTGKHPCMVGPDMGLPYDPPLGIRKRGGMVCYVFFLRGHRLYSIYIAADIVRRYGITGKDEQALHHIAELPDITRPALVYEQLHGLRRNLPAGKPRL